MALEPPARPDPRRVAVEQLVPVAGLLTSLGSQFAQAGHELALVGGPVRDALLGRLSTRPDADLDFTTDAHPEQIQALLGPVAEAVWDVGARFGTIGARVAGREVEITTYRAEQYDAGSRKPDVSFGESLPDDLGCRDFTVNAMALRLPDLEFVDLHGGLADLEAGLLRTPGTPEQSFSDDPLRMMRAARFAAQLGFEVAADVVEAMTSDRPYRAAPGLDAALAEIESNSGALYDSRVAGACVALFREGRFAFPSAAD